MQRVVQKRSLTGELTRERSKVLDFSLRMVVMVSVSIAIGFLIAVIGFWTLSIEKQNAYLRSKIEEMKYTLQSVENSSLEELSEYETIVLDER